MLRWGRRFLESTRGRVVELLRKGEASVNDLAERLGLTDNAIRAHLNTLERDGLVRTAGKRAGVRKPETLYALTPEADRLFPHAYHLLFTRLLDRLRDRMPDEEIEGLLREIGRDLAAEQPLQPARTLRERADRAVEVLERMGGLAEVREEEDVLHIQGFSCPLSAASERHPEVCALAEALLGALLQVPVKEVCNRSGTPRCAFRVPGGDASA